MAEQAGHGDGHGGAPPGRDPGLPDGAACAPGRDAHLPGFAKGGEWDACPPSAALALAPGGRVRSRVAVPGGVAG